MVLGLTTMTLSATATVGAKTYTAIPVASAAVVINLFITRMIASNALKISTRPPQADYRPIFDATYISVSQSRRYSKQLPHNAVPQSIAFEPMLARARPPRILI